MSMTKVNRNGLDRAEPSRLVMSEAVPFAQRYTYHTIHPIEHVLRPDFFMPVRDQLRAGDTIRIVETDVARLMVKRYVDVMVIAGGRHPSGILLHVEHGVVELTSDGSGSVSNESISLDDQGLTVQHRGRGRWAVCRNDVPIETGFKSRSAAELALKQL